MFVLAVSPKYQIALTYPCKAAILAVVLFHTAKPQYSRFISTSALFSEHSLKFFWNITAVCGGADTLIISFWSVSSDYKSTDEQAVFALW